MAFTALIMVIWMDYLVTDIKDITSKRRLVYINYEPAFGLYAGELIAYDITIDRVIEVSKNDKKMDGGKIKFILLSEMGNAYIDRDVTDKDMADVLVGIID